MENKSVSLIDGLGSFFAGESTLKAEVGISSESMVKLAVVAVVTTVICIVITRIIK